jgi:hypothetical protein
MTSQRECEPFIIRTAHEICPRLYTRTHLSGLLLFPDGQEEATDGGGRRRPRIGIVTQVTDSLEPYAGYAVAVNAAAAAAMEGAPLLVEGPLGLHGRATSAPWDERFGKVPLLRKWLEERIDEQGDGVRDGVGTGGGRRFEYLLWMDADAVLVDVEGDAVRRLIDEYPEAHLVACREPRDAQVRGQNPSGFTQGQHSSLG